MAAVPPGARKITLIALWDGKATGDAQGGTADMVRIAQKAGVFDVQVVDAGQLQTDPLVASHSASAPAAVA